MPGAKKQNRKKARGRSDSTTDETERLINAIRERLSIYDMGSIEHRDTTRKEAPWKPSESSVVSRPVSHASLAVQKTTECIDTIFEGTLQQSARRSHWGQSEYIRHLFLGSDLPFLPCLVCCSRVPVLV